MVVARCTGDLMQIMVDDMDLDTTSGADGFKVQAFSDSDPTGLTVTLTETGNHTGLFAAVIEIGAAPDAVAGVLAAADGDVVTGEYDDALDGEGDDPAPVQSTLDVVAS